jgi:hypothetical protein
MDAEEVEEKLRACGRILSQHHVNYEHEAYFICFPYEENIVDDLVLEEGIFIFDSLAFEEVSVSSID